MSTYGASVEDTTSKCLAPIFSFLTPCLPPTFLCRNPQHQHLFSYLDPILICLVSDRRTMLGLHVSPWPFLSLLSGIIHALQWSHVQPWYWQLSRWLLLLWGGDSWIYLIGARWPWCDIFLDFCHCKIKDWKAEKSPLVYKTVSISQREISFSSRATYARTREFTKKCRWPFWGQKNWALSSSLHQLSRLSSTARCLPITMVTRCNWAPMII